MRTFIESFPTGIGAHTTPLYSCYWDMLYFREVKIIKYLMRGIEARGVQSNNIETHRFMQWRELHSVLMIACKGINFKGVTESLCNPFFIFWWVRAESNRRHLDFQSSALPAELPTHKRWLRKKIHLQRCASFLVIAAYVYSTPHSSKLARLESGAFYFAFNLLTMSEKERTTSIQSTRLCQGLFRFPRVLRTL